MMYGKRDFKVVVYTSLVKTPKITTQVIELYYGSVCLALNHNNLSYVDRFSVKRFVSATFASTPLPKFLMYVCIHFGAVFHCPSVFT